MEYLWQKDASSNYIDLFATMKERYSDAFNEWDLLLNGNLKWLNKHKRFAKNNQTSTECLIDGNRKFLVGNWSGAMMSYNQSLCFAVPDSVHESLAYANRSECFFKMKMYIKAYFDIKLALKWKHSPRVARRLNRHLLKYQKILHTGLDIDGLMPTLSFEPHPNHPCMANVLEICENNEFGRHIVAKCDIDAGKHIFVTEVFASGTASGNEMCCAKCNKIEQNFVACKNCASTVFCYGSCSEQMNVHKLECCSFFHIIGDTTLKLPVQTILMAIEMFPSIDNLMKFIEHNNKIKRIPISTKQLKSRYAMFLNLSPFCDEERIYPAYQAYTSLMSISQVKCLFDTERKKRFLMHLTLHHLCVIPQNSFRHERFHQDWICTDYIYDILSLINHSCVPNVFNYSTSHDICYCVTVRPIRKGEQIFINYLGNECKESMEYRQKSLKTWDFECKCAKCVFQAKPVPLPRHNRKEIKSNPSYKYITENCQKNYCKESNSDFQIRLQLKRECVNFLQKFGHLELLREIRFVRHCYTLH